MLVNISKSLKQKGQGIVEYAILLAFIVGLAMMLQGVGLANAVKDTFDSVANLLAGGEKSKTYAEYFQGWRKTSLADLSNISNDERIKADQEGLALLASNFLGLDENGVKDLMQTLSGSGNNYGFNLDNKYLAGADGYSGVLIPLSYNSKVPVEALDGNTGYIWLDSNNNQNTVKLLSSNAEVYDKNDKNSPYYNQGGLNTAATDRLFYSDNMIDTSGTQQRAIALQVHYADNNGTKTVDSVKIAAYTGKANGTTVGTGNNVASGLNLNVTSSGYTVAE